ncbi:MAG: DUF4139 domain-containing protein [Planctomycetes bacterium]|nr:DUF4139 domain-containing protein [Planctomycetota bacterium]
MKHRIKFFLILWLLVCSVAVGKGSEKGTGLTIYNDNFAVVKESRNIEFKKGVNRIEFTDVASAIDPTSVNFKCISAPGAVTILEQNYEYDLVNSQSLLKRYLDKDVTVFLKGSGADTGSEITGKLLASVGNDLILKSKGGGIEIVSKNMVERISLTQLTGDLVTRPTLIWLADAKEKGSQLCRVTYTTGRINWKADYSAVLNDDENKLDFSGWVTIDNKSGATYSDADVKLIAGDVRRAVPARRGGRLESLGYAAAPAKAFEEKAFGEYHMYTLGRKSTINNNQVKQIEFITPAMGVPARKVYVYERSQQADKVQVRIEFNNKKDVGLGIALPMGKVRVFKKDPADGGLEFLGEDRIDHTPAREKLKLYIGNAFDIVPEHTLVDSNVGKRRRTETHKIELRNRKSKAVVINVDEKFPSWVNWVITDASQKFVKHDANTARFKVRLKGDSVTVLRYTVNQTW